MKQDENGKGYLIAWVKACGLGEMIGIGLAALISWIVNNTIGEPSTTGGKVAILIAMAIAGVLEGLSLGWFQWNVIVKRFGGIKVGSWITATVVVAALGWLAGSVPSMFNGPGQDVASDVSAHAEEITIGMVVWVGIIIGIIMGAMFGFAQWIVLRKHAKNAVKWIMANAIGWGIGMVFIFVGATLMPADSGIVMVTGAGLLSGALAGISVGYVTGLFLQKLSPIADSEFA